ncbi:hypothetical protein [Deinococcus aquatilis]|uniref:hypothetical protein n=1 Tax=Deinococcus aquatilis TaxID=519440 RepID=UPI000361F2CA|nr:hypothetical protein [Deinococcus aquatilis]
MEIAQFIAGIAQALKDAALTMDILRLNVPGDIDEQLRALAEAEGEEFWDAALCWTLLHCAEQVPQARAALQPLKAHLDDAVSRAAVEALDDLAAAEAVLNGRGPEPD